MESLFLWVKDHGKQIHFLMHTVEYLTWPRLSHSLQYPIKDSSTSTKGRSDVWFANYKICRARIYSASHCIIEFFSFTPQNIEVLSNSHWKWTELFIQNESHFFSKFWGLSPTRPMCLKRVEYARLSIRASEDSKSSSLLLATWEPY